MIELTLSIAWRGHAAGDTITVDEATAQWLTASGAVAPDIEQEPEPEPSPAPEPEIPTVAPAPAPTPQRPKNAAPVAAWRAYVEHLGYDPAGLTKPQLRHIGRRHAGA